MRKLRIEITVPDDHEVVVRHAMALKVEQLVSMIVDDGPNAFCWTGASNDLTGTMKFTVSTPNSQNESDPYYGLQKGGVYRHFKGTEYVIVGFGKDTESEKILVAYHKLGKYNEHTWLRPAEMFAEKIIKGDREIPRFEFMGAITNNRFT